MGGELVQVALRKVMQSSTYTAIVLVTPQKAFAIYTEPSVGKSIQTLLGRDTQRRPQTHDLIHHILGGLEAKIFQVVIHHVEEGAFFAKLFLEEDRYGLKNIVEIDVRPSDALILALVNNAPIFCTQEVLEKTVPLELNS